MVDVCNPANFPPMKYFQQYELAEFGPAGYDYEYTRCFFTRMEATLTPGIEVDTLNTIMDEYDFNTTTLPGKPKGPGATWEEVLAGILQPPVVSPPTNPFDFALWSKTRIVMMLKGRAWQYSRFLAPITTKHQYGAQYFDLLLHRWGDNDLISVTQEEWQATTPDLPCRCISFYTQAPCPDSTFGGPEVTHGFSLNIELLYYNGGVLDPTRYLPITVDPDIENKGGHS